MLETYENMHDNADSIRQNGRDRYGIYASQVRCLPMTHVARMPEAQYENMHDCAGLYFCRETASYQQKLLPRWLPAQHQATI